MGYYRTYTPHGSGDNIINTLQAHGGPGPESANRKWNVECLDGEAVIGKDSFNDFTSLAQVWCKFMMPYKPPSNGIYPFYPNCFTKNFTTQFFCYTPRFHEASVDTFITGFYDNEFAFNVYREYVDDSAPYKCCKAPTGYYVDYSSCYYSLTHDQYWEYYDSPIQFTSGYFIVYCASGYIMTGLAKKAHPMVTNEYHIEWIQCCRLGFGAGFRPPPPPPPPEPISYGKYQQYPTGSGPSYDLSNSYGQNWSKPLPIAGMGGPYDELSGKSRNVFVDANGLPKSQQPWSDKSGSFGKISNPG
ncbi:hypothetical protein BV898_00182 [Hypsibius exemplaris]|uniref:Uncharacterized protein n=1 Tax=Hypsibius exemplaris TaxID=2072580 RepID=A0A1W0XFA7_HYPEX|nr:hypothetical protein BV898_00182 [Hypsibius exemplaris]